MPSYRQTFSNFVRSNHGREIKSLLYREQRFTCPACRKFFDINKLEIHHIKPVRQLEMEGDLVNLTHISNLILLCKTCNLKQGSKLDKRWD